MQKRNKKSAVREIQGQGGIEGSKGAGPSTRLRTGRIYTITYQAVDDSGNVSIDTVEVVVPHDQR